MINFIHYCPKCGAELFVGAKDAWCKTPGCGYVLYNPYVIDISYKSNGIAKALSNLCNYTFTIDNITCNSMESFIQSLRVSDISLQKEICLKTGPFAYSIRTMLPDWRETHTVYWNGEAIKRNSQKYLDLLKQAYECLYRDSALFKYALDQTKGHTLAHSVGCRDSSETLLTKHEFIYLLNSLRK